MYVVTVDFHVKPQHVDAFRTAVLQQAANSLANEAACRQFDVSVSQEEPGRFFLYEQYDDHAAFEAHVQTDYFHNFGQTITPWVEAKTIRCWSRIDEPDRAA